jgi:hypothetical protein
MASLLFYAGPAYNEMLRNYIESLQLHIYEGQFELPGVLEETSKDTFNGFISFLKPEELHPYPGPAKNFSYRISTVTDPLIMWSPSYTVRHESKNYIIHGNLLWDFSDKTRAEELARGKRYFGQISRWIRKQCPPLHARGVCTGSDALRLIEREGYIAQGIPPNINIERVGCAK